MANITSSGIFGDTRSDGGLLVGAPMDVISESNSNLKIWHEDFKHNVVNTAQMETIGWTDTDVGSPAGSDIITVTQENGYLAIFCGTTADTGHNIQANKALVGTRLTPPHEVMPLVTATATLMDSRELIFKTRIAVSAGDGYATWKSKFALGWITTDTNILDVADGALNIADGGGFGFHCGENGILNTFYQPTTNTIGATETATGVSFASGGSHALTANSTLSSWVELGVRARWIDASGGTGTMEFYVNGQKVQTVTGSLPMQGTKPYCVTYEAVNGPTTVNDLTLAVSSITTGITAPGRSKVTG